MEAEPNSPEQRQDQRQENALGAAANRDEASLRTAGQRRVNLLWEYTQALIAGLVTSTVLLCTGWLVIKGEETMKTAAFGFLVGIANLVIGFYFGRTNHQRTGGIGPNEYGR
jgi:hypothetical protein